MFEILIPILTAGFTAAIWGAYAYLTGKLDKPGEPFVPDKLIGTVIVAFGVGCVMSYMEMPVTQASLWGVLITIGAVDVSQKLFKPLFNKIREWLGLPAQFFG